MSGVDLLGGELIDALIWLQWDAPAISSSSTRFAEQQLDEEIPPAGLHAARTAARL